MTTGRKIARAAGLMIVATLIARILGFVRDMVIYSWFGQTYVTDAYNAAFSIPDFIYLIMVGGALSTAFIPVLSSYFAKEEDEEAWTVASIVFNFTIVLLLVLITIGVIYTRPLILLLVPKLPASSISLAVLLTRVMFIQTFFMALNGISMGILNSKQHFASPALGSILYNVGIISVGIALGHKWGIMAFSVGVVAGAVLSFLVQVPALLKTGLKYTFTFNWRHPGFKQILYLMAPVLVGLSVNEINILVTQYLASGLAEGSISALRLAQRLMQLPVGIFGTAIATVLFPTMTAQVAREEIPAFKRTFSLGLRGTLLISIPAGIGMIALREPLIQLLFQHGQFTADNTNATALALLFYSVGMFAYTALQLVNRVFYSLQDTITPVLIGIVSVGINIGVSLLLVNSMQHSGLALAYSTAGVANLIMLLIIFKLRLKSIDGYKLAKSVVISTGAAAVMYVAVQFAFNWLNPFLHFVPKLNQLILVFGGMGIGIAVYSAIIIMFRLEESQLVLGMLKRVLPGSNHS